jgi:DNA-directed RNA polymerase subunit RPC12/RpoP
MRTPAKESHEKGTIMNDCVMTQSYWGNSYECSECKQRSDAAREQGYRFCPHCGAQIIRFDKVDSRQNVVALVLHEEPPRREVTVAVSYEPPRKRDENVVVCYRESTTTTIFKARVDEDGNVHASREVQVDE